MIRTSLRLALSALFLSLSATAFAAGWSYTDGAGKTVTLDAVPVRIIASRDAAAGLIPLGIRPVGIYADSPVADAGALQGLDLTGIEIIGQSWGEIDIEKAAALEPDLIIAEYWPVSGEWSSGNKLAGPDSPLSALAPITGVTVGDSIIAVIEDYETLAQSTGAALANPNIAAERARFEVALDGFKAAISAKPGLTALAAFAGNDALYIATPVGSSELTDFQARGLDIIVPDAIDPQGYFENLSWENADKYQPDLIMLDNRTSTQLQIARGAAHWTLMKAAAAGAVTRMARLLAAQLRRLCRRTRPTDIRHQRRRREPFGVSDAPRAQDRPRFRFSPRRWRPKPSPGPIPTARARRSRSMPCPSASSPPKTLPPRSFRWASARSASSPAASPKSPRRCRASI
ncbi:ABC transporter substrate-binding protein [Devosia sp. A8/3-2]|nr:ABC transporter substrate-binding protein [Devosia sp. A8/3-2]